MQTLTTEQVKQIKEGNQDFTLINVLPEQKFQAAHIPGSLNIPVGEQDFVNKVEEAAGGKDRKVVVYCASPECDASPKAARQLDEAGFTNVYDYEGGTSAWREANLPVDGSEVPAS